MIFEFVPLAFASTTPVVWIFLIPRVTRWYATGILLVGVTYIAWPSVSQDIASLSCWLVSFKVAFPAVILATMLAVLEIKRSRRLGIRLSNPFIKILEVIWEYKDDFYEFVTATLIIWSLVGGLVGLGITVYTAGWYRRAWYIQEFSLPLTAESWERAGYEVSGSVAVTMTAGIFSGLLLTALVYLVLVRRDRWRQRLSDLIPF